MMSLLFGHTGDWIGLGILVALVLIGLFAVAMLSRPYDVTVEEFEKRAKDAPSLLSAGFIGLQKILQPSVVKAVEAQQDLKKGLYDGEQGSGEPPETEGKSEKEKGKS